MSKPRIWFSLFVLAFMVGSIGFCVRSLTAAERASGWDAFRDGKVVAHPYCSLCSSEKELELHHKKPFHDHPELELDPNNVIVLCRNCHWWAGHCGVAWDAENNEIDELINGVGELLWRKRLAVLAERKQEKRQ